MRLWTDYIQKKKTTLIGINETLQFSVTAPSVQQLHIIYVLCSIVSMRLLILGDHIVILVQFCAVGVITAVCYHNLGQTNSILGPKATVGSQTPSLE